MPKKKKEDEKRLLVCAIGTRKFDPSVDLIIDLTTLN